tara:strand:- start:33 stop:2021 length:1989 start_codon:yes stop_codon:yes gene_type:complete
MAKQLGYPCTDVIPLTQDASARKYFRLDLKPSKENLAKGFLESEIAPSKTAIFCYLDPNLGSQKNFLRIYKYLDPSIRPNILASNLEQGITIQEDLGNCDLYDVWEYEILDYLGHGYYFDDVRSKYYISYDTQDRESITGGRIIPREDEYLSLALDTLNKFKKSKMPKNLKRMKLRDLKNQMDSFEKVYLRKFLKYTPNEIKVIKDELEILKQETISKLEKQQWGNCHTDFEGRNLLYPDWDHLIDNSMDGKQLKIEMHPKLIDYQDTCIGPEGIDLAGLFVDHYHFEGLDSKEIRDVLEQNFGERNFKRIIDIIRWGGIQRNMRILGTLSNLFLEQGRAFRLIDIKKIHMNLWKLIDPDHQSFSNPKYKYNELSKFMLKTLFRIEQILREYERINPGCISREFVTESNDYLEFLEDLQPSKAMILAAGKGSRMLPLTKNTPKPLLKVNGKTLLDHHLLKLHNARFHDVVINSFHHSNKIRKHLMDFKKDLNIKLIEEKELLGTGGGLVNALEYLGSGSVLVINADIYTTFRYPESFYHFSRSNIARLGKYIHIFGIENPDHNKDGDFSYDRNHNVIVNKKKNKFTWTGISIMHTSVIKEAANLAKKEKWETPFCSWEKIILPNIKAGKVTFDVIHPGPSGWIDVGTPERLELANNLFKEEN